jgi:RNase E specificity factor CsrD
MRSTPSLRLSTRLISFVTLTVVAATFILFIGGAISFKQLGNNYLNHYLLNIVEMIGEELEDRDATENKESWLPKLLKASNVVEASIIKDKQLLYSFKEEGLYNSAALFRQTYPLKQHPGYTISFAAIAPYTSVAYSIGPLFSITIAISIIILGLIWGVNWLRQQLLGSELLEERGRMILAGKVDKFSIGDDLEWPATASFALDKLISELKDARQERSRFDTFIRTQTFLDQLTGSANRVLFDSKLESILQDKDSQGAVLVFRLSHWDEFRDEAGKHEGDELIVEVGGALTNLIQKFPDAVLSRYYKSDFAILIPHQRVKEVKEFANQCINNLEKISPPEFFNQDDWLHIGITMFNGGEERSKILEELETSVKTSELQLCNGWTLYKKSNKEEVRSNVRWRTLLDKTFDNKTLFFQRQAVYEMEGKNRTLIHDELLVRIYDENGVEITAARLLPAVAQVGYQVRMDKVVIQHALSLLKESQSTESISINLHSVSLGNRSFSQWLSYELLQLPRESLSHLSFEFSEGQLLANYDAARPVIKRLLGFGCSIIVDQVGRTIVSTHYIKDIRVSFLKLHRNLITDIDKRQENQLFVRSIIGSCANTDTKVLAVGVDNQDELDILQQLGVAGAQGELFNLEGKPKERFMKFRLPKRRSRWG